MHGKKVKKELQPDQDLNPTQDGPRTISYEEFLQELEDGGARIGKVSSEDKQLADYLTSQPDFLAEASRIFSEAIESGRETQGIRIYRINDDHYIIFL